MGKDNKPKVPASGKYDVLFPVGFPDEGTFEWLDGFLEKNPQYVELSDRMIHDWIQKSGVWKCKNQGRISNDKPPFHYNVKFIDDNSIRRAVHSVAPLTPRHYVVMEVKQNLMSADRAANLQRFNLPHFKRIAHVVMGEPKAEFKERVHKRLLECKQLENDDAWRKKKLELERKKAVKEQRKAAVARKKQIEEQQAKIREEANKKREALLAKQKEEEQAKKKEEDAQKKEEGKESGDVDMKETDGAKEDKKDGATSKSAFTRGFLSASSLKTTTHGERKSSS